MMKRIILTPSAPSPIGPYSQAVKVGVFPFRLRSGSSPPGDSKIEASDIESQTRQTLENVKAIVEAGGLSMSDIVKVSIYLRNADDLQKMNQVYRELLRGQSARTTVEAKFPAPRMLVEIDAIAYHDWRNRFRWVCFRAGIQPFACFSTALTRIYPLSIFLTDLPELTT